MFELSAILVAIQRFRGLHARGRVMGLAKLYPDTLLSVVILVIALVASVRANAADESLVNLGRALFEDRSLSGDRRVSCASCHLKDHAFSDSRPLSMGNRHHRGTRNAPSLVGLANYRTLFWDGRAEGLADQARFPLFSPAEMGLSSEAQLLDRVRQNQNYMRAFEHLLGNLNGHLRVSDIAHALAVYEQSLVPPETAYDQYVAGDDDALSQEAKAVPALFNGKVGCSVCHMLGARNASFTDNLFHESAVGLRGAGAEFPKIATRLAHLPLQQRIDLIPTDRRVAELGRFVVTLDPKDIGAFRTPSLRSARVTAPYMHDGSVATLQQAVDLELYYRGLKQGYPVNFSLAERREIRVFIESASASSSQPQRHPHSALTAILPSVRNNFIVSTHHE